MDDWGFAGPVFGLLTGVSLTYLQHVRLWVAGGDEVHLWSHGDLLVWDDGYFGDVEVFVAETSACQPAESVASCSPSAEGDRP